MTERKVSSERVSEERVYLIRKGGAWYRPDSAGYTTNAHEAGRYTLEEAEKITHPNGPNGPRDAMSYQHQDSVPALRSSVKTVGVPEAMELLREALAAESKNQSRRNEMLATLIVNLEKGEPTAELAIALRDFVQRERPKLSAIEAPSEGEGYPRLKTVRAHKHTCANVQPGSTYADKCDCGALDTAGNAIEITRPSPAASSEVTEEMRKEALRLLQERDERDDRVQDMIEDLREIVLLMPAADRPEGLMKQANAATYAMRGRTRLMDDAALTAALKGDRS